MGETPIVFVDRRGGKSKANLRESIRSMAIILWFGGRSMLGIDKRAVNRGR